MTFGHELNIPVRYGVATDKSIAVVSRENEQLRFATKELGHRIRNLVAIIQSIARQTLKQTATFDDFDARFAGRLAAIGGSLDLLIDDDWRGAPVDELVHRQLAAFDRDGVQIAAEGPLVALEPEAARTIGLALHELATNASKYGALSVAEGKVRVLWEIVVSGERRRFRMAWREYGGPTVTEPSCWGFGRQVIQQLTAQSLGGKVTHEFAPEGVRWTLDMPATFLVRSQE